MTGVIPLQNYQVFIYKLCGFDSVMSLILTAVWGTVVVIAVVCLSPWMDRIGRRKCLFIGYSFIIPGSLIIVITWARFDAGDRTDLGIAKAIIFGMFFMVFGYAGILNAFPPCVSPPVL
jgi:MFS family permease